MSTKNRDYELYPDGFDCELIESNEEDPWNPRYKYICPCGKGFLHATLSKYDGDNLYYFDCKDCAVTHEILWGKGISPCSSPMVRKTIGED